jgi:CheY-like chemotaxis protein
MDGVEACRLINAREGGHPKPKIVFVSAHVQDHYKNGCSQAGAVDYRSCEALPRTKFSGHLKQSKLCFEQGGFCPLLASF